MKKRWKTIVMIALAAVMLLVFAGCEQRKTGNRITGGEDAQTFTYCFVVPNVVLAADPE